MTIAAPPPATALLVSVEVWIHELLRILQECIPMFLYSMFDESEGLKDQKGSGLR